MRIILFSFHILNDQVINENITDSLSNSAFLTSYQNTMVYIKTLWYI